MATTEPRLCQDCRKHTLQALYRGTDYYQPSDACDLCALILDALPADKQWRRVGDGPRLISLRANYDPPLFRFRWREVSSNLQLGFKRALAEYFPAVRPVVFFDVKRSPLALIDVHVHEETQNGRGPRRNLESKAARLKVVPADG